MSDLLRLKVGDVLTFDYPATKPVSVELNGKLKHTGHIVISNRKRSIKIVGPVDPAA
jgi:flagellar motor switch protein FliM